MKLFLMFLMLSISTLPYALAQLPNPQLEAKSKISVRKGKLALYEQADFKSAMLTEIDSLEELQVSYELGKPLKVDNIRGRWQAATYQDKQGFVFNGFLSSLPMPQIGASDLGFFVTQYFHSIQTTHDQVKCWTPFSKQFFDTDSTTTIFSNNWILKEKRSDYLTYVSLEIPNVTLEEVLLWSQFFDLPSRYFNYAKPKKKQFVEYGNNPDFLYHFKLEYNYFFKYHYDKEKRLNYLEIEMGYSNTTDKSVVFVLEYNKNKAVCLTTNFFQQ